MQVPCFDSFFVALLHPQGNVHSLPHRCAEQGMVVEVVDVLVVVVLVTDVMDVDVAVVDVAVVEVCVDVLVLLLLLLLVDVDVVLDVEVDVEVVDVVQIPQMKGHRCRMVGPVIACVHKS